VDYLIDRIPQKRSETPHDLDGAMVFLASDAAEYVAGQTLLIYGGITTGSPRALPAQKKTEYSLTRIIGANIYGRIKIHRYTINR